MRATHHGEPSDSRSGYRLENKLGTTAGDYRFQFSTKAGF